MYSHTNIFSEKLFLNAFVYILEQNILTNAINIATAFTCLITNNKQHLSVIDYCIVGVFLLDYIIVNKAHDNLFTFIHFDFFGLHQNEETMEQKNVPP